MIAIIATGPLTVMDTAVVNHTSSTPSTLVNPNRGMPLATPTIDREQMKLEFYRTYDVMTGVRIAATLGGFFSLMVLLVVYKSKCKSKSLSDEDLTAAAAAAAEAATASPAEAKDSGFSTPFTFAPEARRGQRQSLGNMSAPAFVRTRFSSIGGYSTLDASPFLNYQRGKSLPGSALQFPFTVGNTAMASSYLAEPEDSFVESPSCYYHRFLTVPQDERRLSSITCSSSDTSYLERRGSAAEMGLPAPPPKAGAAQEMWDFYYPIDIQIIQPTPEASPCGSERTLYDHPVPEGKASLSVPRLAPLASISSCAVSLSDCSEHSVGSDSVFMDDDDEDLDTEDEVEGFSTDSESTEVGEKWLPPSSAPFAQHLLQIPVPTSAAPAGRWAPAAAGYRPKRRFSAPCHKKSVCETISALVDEPISEVTPAQRPQHPLPASSSDSSESVTIPAVVCDSPASCERSQRSKSLLAMPSFPLLIGGSCEHLARVLRDKTSSSVTDNCAWSQETLF